MDKEALKMSAARTAAEHVESGMKLGIGSGSTAEAFVRVLAEKVAGGLEIIGVPTSRRTEELCREFSVPLTSLEEEPQLDLAIDGADEIGPGLDLIKGGGGALLREKIVAAAARRMIVIADEGKLVDTLGRFPLPIEINAFGSRATISAIETVASRQNLSGELKVRMAGDGPFVTDGGHLIVDASFGRIPATRTLADALNAIPGVVEHGLFIGMADMAILAGENGVRKINA